ncbi:MAG TPA: tol-pal system-associated acyl-CoA thioesterase [Burkholderiaceae bacterium]|nr:tol-pal system-associated acyl-CoA thioesterase [Burkholderiaceae bacterium]
MHHSAEGARSELFITPDDRLRMVHATSWNTAEANSGPGVAFRWTIRVYYEDTDAGQVVYYANYLKFFERCRTEWLRALGVDQSALAREAGLQFAVTEIEARYLQPARLDDELTIEARLAAIGRCSLVFEQLALREDAVVAQARVKVACVDSQRRMPARLPQALLGRIRPLAPGSSA